MNWSPTRRCVRMRTAQIAGEQDRPQNGSAWDGVDQRARQFENTQAKGELGVESGAC